VTLKPHEAKAVRTQETDSILVLEERTERAGIWQDVVATGVETTWQWLSYILLLKTVLTEIFAA